MICEQESNPESHVVSGVISLLVLFWFSVQTFCFEAVKRLPILQTFFCVRSRPLRALYIPSSVCHLCNCVSLHAGMFPLMLLPLNHLSASLYSRVSDWSSQGKTS